MKTLAHYSVFVWGNIAYFESIDVDCDSGKNTKNLGLKSIGLVALGFGYVLCGFMLIGIDSNIP